MNAARSIPPAVFGSMVAVCVKFAASAADGMTFSDTPPAAVRGESFAILTEAAAFGAHTVGENIANTKMVPQVKVTTRPTRLDKC